MDPFDDHPLCWRDGAWLAFWGSFAALDYYADRRKHSFSEGTTRFFRIRTSKGGQVAFTVVYAVGAVVLWSHIVKKKHRQAVWGK